jgi:hypothetical protein
MILIYNITGIVISLEFLRTSDNVHMLLTAVPDYLLPVHTRCSSPTCPILHHRPHWISFSQPFADGASAILTPLPPFISKSLGRSILPGSGVHDAASMAILLYLLISQFRSTVKTE